MTESDQAPQQPKTVIGIIVGLTDDGKRTIGYSSETQDKDKLHLAQVRELLQWALASVNDSITQGIMRMELDRMASKTIVKPGFRPMNLLKSIMNGNEK